MIIIKPQTKADTRAIESLLENAFGADRLKKTFYRLRYGAAQVKDM